MLCPGADAGGGIQAVYLTNLISGASKRLLQVRALYTFPDPTQTYTCELFLSGQTRTTALAASGIIVLQKDTRFPGYGSLSVSAPLNSQLSENCYHEMYEVPIVPTFVRTADCADGAWPIAATKTDAAIDVEGDQEVRGNGKQFSRRNDIRLSGLKVGQVFTVNGSVSLTTCNTATPGESDDKCARTSGSNPVVKSVIYTSTSGCTLAMALSKKDPNYTKFNGTASKTVLSTWHHDVVFVQKKVKVKTVKAGAICNVRARVDTTAKGKDVLIGDRHTRLYSVSG